MQFKPCQILSAQLDNLPIEAGQFIVVTDTQEIFLDKSDSERISISREEPPEIREYTNRVEFPAEGEAGILYVNKTNNNLYRWDGNDYISLSADIDTYDKATIDSLIETLSDKINNTYDKDTIDGLMNNVYTKNDIDTKFAAVDQDTGETREWVLDEYYDKDYIDEHYYTKTQIDSQIGDIVTLMENL